MIVDNCFVVKQDQKQIKNMILLTAVNTVCPGIVYGEIGIVVFCHYAL